MRFLWHGDLKLTFINEKSKILKKLESGESDVELTKKYNTGKLPCNYRDYKRVKLFAWYTLVERIEFNGRSLTFQRWNFILKANAN